MRCPRCGSTRVQLTTVRGGHGCLWFLLLGWYYVIWVIIRWCIGFLVLCYWDWWVAIIQALRRKGYAWKCRRFFRGTTKYYYCHKCSRNFRG